MNRVNDEETWSVLHSRHIIWTVIRSGSCVGTTIIVNFLIVNPSQRYQDFMTVTILPISEMTAKH